MREVRPYKIIALDFDGTLCLNGWPYISYGIVNPKVKKLMAKEIQKTNGQVIFILWTCRDGKALEEAKGFCEANKIPIAYYNENDPSIESWFTCFGARKIFADEYWDDKAVRI